MSTPKLFPVKVPWCISLSAPAIHFEIEDFGVPSVHFRATFTDAVKGHYEEIVNIKFFTVKGVQIQHGEMDGRSIDDSEYDWSEIRSESDIMNIKKYLHDLEINWLKTSLCPDPLFYVVNQSESDKLNDYLLVGEDISIRIQAEEFTWSVI